MHENCLLHGEIGRKERNVGFYDLIKERYNKYLAFKKKKYGMSVNVIFSDDWNGVDVLNDAWPLMNI